MKKMRIALAALILALSPQLVCAQTPDVVQNVFDALTAEDSDYNQTKILYAGFDEGIQWGEAVEGDSIVISVTNSEYMDGSWTFTQEGDYLTATFGGEDYTGLSMMMSVLQAVGRSLDMKTDVMNGYVNGLSILDMESDNFIMEQDEESGETTVRIYDAAAWDMKELDEMVLDENVVEPLEEGYTSTAANIGKLMMVANGSDDGMVILLGEFGGLDEAAYQSVMNVVSILKPAGWEDFTAQYTELADAGTDTYSVKLDVSADEVQEIIDDPKDSYSYAIIRFGNEAD